MQTALVFYKDLAFQDYIGSSLILQYNNVFSKWGTYYCFCFVQAQYCYIDLLENNGWLFWE